MNRKTTKHLIVINMLNLKGLSQADAGLSVKKPLLNHSGRRMLSNLKHLPGFTFLQQHSRLIAVEAERINGPFGAGTRQPSHQGRFHGVSMFRSTSAALSLI